MHPLLGVKDGRDKATNDFRFLELLNYPLQVEFRFQVPSGISFHLIPKGKSHEEQSTAVA